MAVTVVSREQVRTVVHDVVSTILPGVPRHDITGDKHLKDLGADSVDRVEIVLSLIDRVGVEQPMSSFSDLPTLDALIDFLVDNRRQ